MDEEIQIQEPLPLIIDDFGQQQLVYGSRWAKFLAIFAIVCCGLMVLAGFVLCLIPTASRGVGMESLPYRKPVLSYGFLGCVYFIIAILYFFPSLYLLQFAQKIKSALLTHDQDTLNVAFQKLKMMFRYSGIMVITLISLYLVIIIFAVVVAVTHYR